MSEAKHATLMIPGPIEFHESVYQAVAKQTVSHISKDFIEEFGASLQQLRSLFLTKDGQPLVLAGSGTLGWDVIAANVLEEGQRVLLLNTGLFADLWADCLETYGMKVDQIRTPFGQTVDYKEVEEALKANKYSMICVTHVDTSTSIRNDIKAVAALAKKIQPEILVAVDGVCSMGGEEFRMDDWGIDIGMTCSQKCMGVPPGLCIMIFSQKSVGVVNGRSTPIRAHYFSLKHWFPIMQKYEARQACYFATPPVNLIRGLYASLKYLHDLGVEEVFRRHANTAKAFRAAIDALGLKTVVSEDKDRANTLTAIYMPEGFAVPDLLSRVISQGVVVAGGLHRTEASKYFRVGHMGLTSLEATERGFVAKALEAFENALIDLGFNKFTKGASVEAFNKSLSTSSA